MITRLEFSAIVAIGFILCLVAAAMVTQWLTIHTAELVIVGLYIGWVLRDYADE